MFKKILFTLCLGASALSVANAGSQDFIESIFKDTNVKYTMEKGKVISKWNNERTVVCYLDEEQSLLRVYGYSITRVPRAKRSQALEKLNELSRDKKMCFYLDSDGDVCAAHMMDTDDMQLSKPAFLLTLSRMLKGLSCAREEMMKIRYRFE